MLVRLLLTLMLAIGAAPMPAACHAHMPMATHAVDGHAMPAPATGHHDRHPATEHGCIGCAALDDWMSDRARPPIAPAAARPDSPRSSILLARANPPTLRPPRIG